MLKKQMLVTKFLSATLKQRLKSKYHKIKITEGYS